MHSMNHRNFYILIAFIFSSCRLIYEITTDNEMAHEFPERFSLSFKVIWGRRSMNWWRVEMVFKSKTGGLKINKSKIDVSLLLYLYLPLISNVSLRFGSFGSQRKCGHKFGVNYHSTPTSRVPHHDSNLKPFQQLYCIITMYLLK